MKPLLLGIELELKVKENTQGGFWAGPYEVFISWPKGQSQGHSHSDYGNLAQKAWELSGEKIRVGYDLTVGSHGTGFEFTADPLSIADCLATWKTLYPKYILSNFTNKVSGVTDAGNPKECGMHIHVSPVGPKALKRLGLFINNPENGTLIHKVAGRYNNHYCHTVPDFPVDKVDSLYHSKECKNEGKIKIGWDYVDTDYGDDQPTLEEWESCCDNAIDHAENLENRVWTVTINEAPKRAALNVLPSATGGDIEFRLFTSPMTWPGFATRVQFVHALVRWAEFSSKDFKDYVTETPERRIRYPDLIGKMKW